jgi:hypothetical protein
MRASTVLVLAFFGLLAVACERDRGADDPSGYGQPTHYDQYGHPVYGQPGQPAQPGQPGYNQPAYPPQPGQPPTYGQPGPQGTTSQPGGLALPCQSDLTCGTHKCNLAAGRCAFPCQNSMADCAAGLACVAGGCVPGIAPPQ